MSEILRIAEEADIRDRNKIRTIIIRDLLKEKYTLDEEAIQRYLNESSPELEDFKKFMDSNIIFELLNIFGLVEGNYEGLVGSEALRSALYIILRPEVFSVLEEGMDDMPNFSNNEDELMDHLGAFRSFLLLLSAHKKEHLSAIKEEIRRNLILGLNANIEIPLGYIVGLNRKEIEEILNDSIRAIRDRAKSRQVPKEVAAFENDLREMLNGQENDWNSFIDRHSDFVTKEDIDEIKSCKDWDDFIDKNPDFETGEEIMSGIRDMFDEFAANWDRFSKKYPNLDEIVRILIGNPPDIKSI